jgi:hypothetical protein
MNANQGTKQELTPNVQVRFSLERTRASYDRTLMSWIRTARWPQAEDEFQILNRRAWTEIHTDY